MSQLNSQIPANAEAVSPSDSAYVRGVALYCGGAGNVSLVTEGGQTVTFIVQAGTVIVQRFVQVRSTGTTATGLVRQW